MDGKSQQAERVRLLLEAHPPLAQGIAIQMAIQAEPSMVV